MEQGCRCTLVRVGILSVWGWDIDLVGGVWWGGSLHFFC
jgi:hypothetical protein